MNSTNRFARSRWHIAACFLVVGAATHAAVAAKPRQMEALDRGLVAIERGGGVYLSWRWLGTEADDLGFHVYRNGVRVTDTPLRAGQFFDADGAADDVYRVRPATLRSAAVPAGVRAPAAPVWRGDYLAVPIQRPEGGVAPDGVAFQYAANDGSVGDLDGDGQYEIVVKWDPTNAKDNSQDGHTGEVFIDAYEFDGTRLWRIGLGRNIRAGAHYTQFMVYDFDGDGYAEVAMKTADGTTDGEGVVIGDPGADYRNEAGRVLDGLEFLTVFDGQTGAALTTVDYDPPRGDVCDWGDCYGNRVDRFLAGVAYLDGERPSLVMARGYYTRTVLVAYDWRDGQLTQRWTFDSDEGLEDYAGQGNHSLSVGDVDGDGRDEITYGAMAVDDDGMPLYNTGLGHGDALHLGDLDPVRPGLEVFDVHESSGAAYGIEFRDAASGGLLWGVNTGRDTGRGMSADIDPRFFGEEFWASGGFGLFNTTGGVISETSPRSINFGIWWDGDLNRELLDHEWFGDYGVPRIDKWDYVNSTDVNLLYADGARSNNWTKGTPVLQADLWGDWREEAIWRDVDSTELRVFTSTVDTPHRLRTLMHDPIYRLSIAWQNVAYNQPPHPGFYLGVGMTPPPAPDIYVVRPTPPAGR